MPAGVERRGTRAVMGRVCRIQLPHARAQRGGDLRDVARVEMQMRVARSVQVAKRAVKCDRPVDQLHHARRLEIAALTGLNAVVAGLPLHERQPGSLEVGAGADDQIGPTRTRDETRACVYPMRVLQRRRRRIDTHLVAAQLLHQRSPFRGAGENLQRCGRRPRGEHQKDGKDRFHG